LLSIIIPTLNEEKYVGKLLDCLVRQTYKDFEVIVVDGGSEDNTIKVIGKYNGLLKIKIIQSRKHLSFNRNLGVKKAKNEKILFLDSDVKFNEKYLGESLSQMNRYKLRIATSRLRPLEKSWYNKLFITMCNVALSTVQYFKPMGYGCCLFTEKAIHKKINGWDFSVGWGNDLNYVKMSSKYGKFRLLSTYVNYSMRRFEKYGTKANIKKFLRAFYYTLTNQDKKISKIPFQFGGF